MNKTKPFTPPITFEKADNRASELLSRMTIDQIIELIGGHNMFFIKGYEELGIPEFYLADATQGIHIRKEIGAKGKSTAFPAPIALTATWNPKLSYQYAESVGEQCRANNVAVLLGPGINIYRISQNGRNFEYFGEDPFLAARMVEQYVAGVQSTGTIATLKHFLCNNTDHKRRFTNSVVDERTLNEIYLPAFKAGIDAGAMALMTAYNQVNGEWCGQSEYVIKNLLRQNLGFKWLVMTDWWSTFDPEKVIKSGMDLDMPGHALKQVPALLEMGDVFVRTNAARLLEEGKVTRSELEGMARSIMRTFIAMGLYDREVTDTSYIDSYPKHEEVALNTAREAHVLLRNESNILPINPQNTSSILLMGQFTDSIPQGTGAAWVDGYGHITLKQALQDEFGTTLWVEENPTDSIISESETVILSIGTIDGEGYDRPFDLPSSTERMIERVCNLNKNVVVVVNSGGGVNMSRWCGKVKAIIYGWYPGQNGYKALAEILVGKINPSGKLPITIEKRFEDSPGYPYITPGEEFDKGMENDLNWSTPMRDIEYKEGVFVGYRWYISKGIEPLFPFGFGLSYTNFEYSNVRIIDNSLSSNNYLKIGCTITNTGSRGGSEVAQLYIHPLNPSVLRPHRELKGFCKVHIEPNESKEIEFELNRMDFAYYCADRSDWVVETGENMLQIGTSSVDIRGELVLDLV